MKQQIENLATLAKLKVGENIVKSFDEILSYIKSVEEVLSMEGNDVEIHKTTDCKNVFREDEVTNKKGEYTERIISQAKERDGNWIKVKAYDLVSQK